MALFFPMMIAGVASESGIKTPNFATKRSGSGDPNDFDANEYPHFHVFCEVTLGKPINASSWDMWATHNAKVIAALSEERVKAVTYGDLVDMGLEPSCR